MTADIKDIKSAIEKQGFEWQAGETSISTLSFEQQKSLLGLQVSEDELRATARAIEAANELDMFRAGISAPASIDWRNHGGDWTTPIKDQKSCGSCVAFATAATLEARINLACKNAAMDPDLSEAHLFYCGCGNCCSSGWNFAPALEFAKNTGVAKEADFPYTPSNPPCKSGLSPFTRITAWRSVMGIAERKNLLSSKGPMVAGMAVYQDFFSYRSGVYRHATGNLAGYHAISVVGYNDSQKCWICKNSWGASWGDSGWFRIAYGDSGIDSQFAFYDVDLACPQDACEKWLPYLRNVLATARRNAMLRACLRYHVCRIGRPVRCSSAILNVVRTVQKVLAACPKYRLSFCRALAV